MCSSSLFWSYTSTLNNLWRKNSVIISRTSKTIRLWFKMQASGSVWRDKPLRLKGLNFTLQIEQEHFKWAGTPGILLRFKCAGKTFQIKSANNAVQMCTQYFIHYNLHYCLWDLETSIPSLHSQIHVHFHIYNFWWKRTHSENMTLSSISITLFKSAT